MLECMERDVATLLVEKRGMTIRQALGVFCMTLKLIVCCRSRIQDYIFSLLNMCIRFCRKKWIEEEYLITPLVSVIGESRTIL